ncbi:ankyrin repeat domain-containing protein [Patescibacteria group bacterium]|nr:ankyrin repeat domain-containing protein [Patescibacteria group bacterium]
MNGRNGDLQQTLLMIASECGHSETVEFLLNYPKPGLQIDAVDVAGNTV